MQITTSDNDKCRRLEERDLVFKAQIEFKEITNHSQAHNEKALFEFKFDFLKTPARENRLLFDQFHSLKFPENGYVLKDSLSSFDHPFEWNGDHIFTNFVQMHQRLTEMGGYSIEVLSDPFTCFDANNYGALMIIDTEDYFSEAEI